MKEGSVSWCPSCSSYSVLFQSSAFSFTWEELNQFYELLCSLRAHQFDADDHRVLIRSNHHPVGFIISEKEVTTLKSALLEVIQLEYQLHQLAQ